MKGCSGGRRMLKLEDLQVDRLVAGIEPSAPVKLLYIRKAGDDPADGRRGRRPQKGLLRRRLLE